MADVALIVVIVIIVIVVLALICCTIVGFTCGSLPLRDTCRALTSCCRGEEDAPRPLRRGAPDSDARTIFVATPMPYNYGSHGPLPTMPAPLPVPSTAPAPGPAPASAADTPLQSAPTPLNDDEYDQKWYDRYDDGYYEAYASVQNRTLQNRYDDGYELGLEDAKRDYAPQPEEEAERCQRSSGRQWPRLV